MSSLVLGQKGFTLIEVLIVVAIIAILVSIAIPKYASYKKTVYDSAALADLTNFKMALSVYHSDHLQYP
ncbi:prepilin-type N-terminal cleavage/methylation domain-containing protein [Geomonas sp. Red32]|uniref:type IV pilin protein n=1 Tax=Geomonas sp. Red32 TaxID=2912856 RepID=UPI00254604FE|nr:prepilin-type N-terminal cleavage/methylation domain-containing protein [Geomonas sp. Red32]